MAYVINLTNGGSLVTVEDGTIDQSTSLKLVGKNYAGYGEIQNENFIHLLENFSSANQPAGPLNGQIWFDNSQKKLKFYDGTKFRTTGGAEISTTQPVGLTTGDFWWDTSNNQLYAQNSDGGFVLIGPQSIGETVSAMVTAQVRDSNQVNRTIIKGTVDDGVVFIVSNAEFTIDTTDAANAITGFDVVRQGLTLRNTTSAASGVTSSAHRFHGTATNAEKLGGVAAADYALAGAANFSSVVRFADAGFTVGAANDLAVFIDESGSGNEGVIDNTVGQKIRFKVKSSGGVTTEPFHIQSGGLIPTTTTTYDIGDSNYKWRNMYATSFNGLATQAIALQVGSNYRTGDVNPTNNTVAVRDSSGNIAANVFNGISTSARYADLAEKYSTDQNYPVGTLMTIGGDAESTACEGDDTCIGVISTKPAYLMNSDADGQAIALVGRVPVRITGPVNKGDKVYISQNGTASAVTVLGDMIGIALETNDRHEETLVECILKL
ncbi:MAG: hypothetical protein CMD92_08900 [Gammaproteobacteria bacterium]|nr:hypothetical protein [Gammaproteobacteria bacterium]|tara:strand:+ start:1203 stop:2681 length:1479 start_codon:yes stop_codon:yes gene_type:complete